MQKNVKRTPKARATVIILAIALMLVGTASLTMAYIFLTTDSLRNTFNPSTVSSPDIQESFDRAEKENVTVKVTGDTDCYVRAMIVITLQDDEGNTVAKTPVEGTDYTISLGTDWQYIAPYYYYKGIVKAGQSTTNLINSCVSNNSEYHLSVDVISQTIQADGVITSGDNAGTVGTPAVAHAWGMTYSDGSWSAGN